MARMHRFYTDQALQPGQLLTVMDERAHYLSRVLRVSAGQTVILFNGDGLDYLAQVRGVNRSAITLQLGDPQAACAESPLHITLVQAVSRGERMDLSLQKATELGVSAFQPVFSVRAGVRLQTGKLEKRMEHWRKVIISACEQSGRACIPKLHRPIELALWAQQPSRATRIALMPGSESLGLVRTGSAVELLVGPEGGFDAREIEHLERHGVRPAGLGPRILRTETAGPAAVAILQALAGDFA